MTQKYSRGHWSQITSRVKQAKFIFDRGWKCLICGKKFSGHECTHTITDNEAAILRVREETVRS